MMRVLLVTGLLLAACSKSSSNKPPPATTTPPATTDPLTGVWQGTVDAGSRAAILRFIIVEDAGTLSGFQAVNDPEKPDEFHTIDRLNGTRNGNDVILRSSTETITATLDGGVPGVSIRSRSRAKASMRGAAWVCRTLLRDDSGRVQWCYPTLASSLAQRVDELRS
jgi:hypothetical protein